MDKEASDTVLERTVAALIRIVLMLTFCGVMLSFSTWTTTASIIKDVVLVIPSGLIAILLSMCPACQARLWVHRWSVLPFLAFGVIVSLSYFFSDASLPGTGQIATMWAILICVVAIFGLDIRPGSCRNYTSMVAALAVITVVYAFVQHAGLDPIAWEGFGGRVFSSFGHPNFFASFLTFVLPIFILDFLHAGNRWWRVCLASIIAASLVALMLTRSRAAWLSFIMCLPLLPFLGSLNRPGLRRTMIVTACLIVVMMAVILLNPAVGERFRSLADMSDPSLQSRLLMYSGIGDAFLDKPFLGWGTGSFTTVFPLYHPTELYLLPPFNRDYLVNNAHSEYLELLLENGLLGFASFILIVLSAFRRTWNGLRSEKAGDKVLARGIMIGLFAILIQNMVCVSLRFLTTQFLFWTGLALMIVLSGPAPSTGGLRPPKRTAQMTGVVSGLLLSTLFIVYAFPVTLQRYRAEVATMRASRAQQREDTTQALRFLEQALVADPYAIETLNLAADLALAQKRYVEAERSLRKILSINPRHPLTHYHLAMTRFAVGDTDGTLRLLAEASRWRPHAWQIEDAYGRLALFTNDREAATRHFQRTIDLNGDAINALFSLGNLAFEAGEHRQALSWYARVISLESQSMGVWHNAGLVNRSMRERLRERKIKDRHLTDMTQPRGAPLTSACAIQPSHSVISPVLGTISGLRQTFLSTCDTFSLIRFRIATRRQSFPYCFQTRLSRLDDDGLSLVSSQRLSMNLVSDNQLIEVRLTTPPTDARDATFVFELMADPACRDYPLFVWVQLKDDYHSGELTIDGIPIGGDLEFDVTR